MASTVLITLLSLFSPLVSAVRAYGRSGTGCTGTNIATCINLAPNACCRMPTGGLVAASIEFWDLLQGDVVTWHRGTTAAPCGGLAIDSDAGPGMRCLTRPITGGVILAGGGAQWFPCLEALVGRPAWCNTLPVPGWGVGSGLRKRRSKDAFVNAVEEGIASGPACNTTVLPTVWAWEDAGAWSLDLNTLSEEMVEKFYGEEHTDDVS